MRLIVDSSPLLKERIRRSAFFLLFAFRQLKGDRLTLTFPQFGTAEEFVNRTGFIYLQVDADETVNSLGNKAVHVEYSRKPQP